MIIKNKLSLLSLLLISGLILSVGSCKKTHDPGDWNIVPEPKEEPKEEEDEEEEEETITLKVMTYYGRVSADPADYLQKVTDHIKEYDPDLLFIRQIDKSTTRSNNIDMPREFGEVLNMEYLFVSGLDLQGGEYGNAVFSKFPIVASEAITLLSDPVIAAREGRTMPMITVQIDEKNQLTFAGTELDPTHVINRVLQIGDVLERAEKIETPFILAANFNDSESGQIIDMVKEQFTFGCIVCPANNPIANPTKILDYILFKESDDLIVDSYAVFPKAVSHALPMTAEFKMKLVE